MTIIFSMHSLFNIQHTIISKNPIDIQDNMYVYCLSYDTSIVIYFLIRNEMQNNYNWVMYLYALNILHILKK